MKIRLDFVTNSSSSSFILGKPGESKLTSNSARKYLKKIGERFGEEVGAEFVIDLKYDKSREYTKDEIDFVLGAIYWYLDEDNENINLEEMGDGTYDKKHDIWWRINADNEYEESDCNFWLPDIDKEFNQKIAQDILNFAHKYLGEILVGNEDIGFYPYESFEEVLKDKNIEYKCGHMG